MFLTLPREGSAIRVPLVIIRYKYLLLRPLRYHVSDLDKEHALHMPPPAANPWREALYLLDVSLRLIDHPETTPPYRHSALNRVLMMVLL